MEQYKALADSQRHFFYKGATKDISFRIEQLTRLKEAVKQHEAEILAALHADLNKSEFEAYLTEIGYVYNEINEVITNVKKWVEPLKVKTPITHIGSQSFIYYEPYGVALIIAPWNYPFQLALTPLIGAMVAGNCAIVKPSELTPHTANVLSKIMEKTFPREYIAVVEGEADVAQALMQAEVDYIFFTGSPHVGKIVMETAAKSLTPVTLELGGKSPTIVHHDAKLKIAANRIIWGKFLNAGQTCVAPDYLLVHKKIKQKFLRKLSKAIEQLYGKDSFKNENYPVIVNDKHYQRLTSYLQDGNIVIGGRHDALRRVIEPTVIDEVSLEARVMQDGIFGPILPVIEYEELGEVISIVRKHRNPLALYLFTENKQIEEQILMELSFGGGCINDTLYHLGTPYLPFGGVGQSGMGAYHGKFSFETFSHRKSILKQTSKVDLPIRYPNREQNLKMIKRLFK